MGEGKPASAPHPATQERSPQGGTKDTNDLSDIQAVQNQGMQEKAKQVEQTPKDVTGEHDAIQPQNQRR